jgi:hypothetical protein
MPGTRHQRRAYFPGRQLCGPWKHKPTEPSSKRPIIIERIIGAVAIIAIAIIGIVPVIGTVIIIGIDTIIGTPITAVPIITTGIHIIGNAKKPNKSRDRKTAYAAGFRLITQVAEML